MAYYKCVIIRGLYSKWALILHWDSQLGSRRRLRPEGYWLTQPDANNVRHPGDDFCLRVVLKIGENSVNLNTILPWPDK